MARPRKIQFAPLTIDAPWADSDGATGILRLEIEIRGTLISGTGTTTNARAKPCDVELPRVRIQPPTHALRQAAARPARPRPSISACAAATAAVEAAKRTKSLRSLKDRDRDAA